MCHTAPVTQPTQRELNRRRTQAEILRVAREHLGTVGAAALSLRAVARDLGMVSSAIYRYVDSRDELLTRLIDDAYNSMADAVDAATTEPPEGSPLEQWMSAAHAIRDWALEHRHEYALVYGSPVPGYEAPERTSVSGTRVTRRLVAIVQQAATDGRLAPPSGDRVDQPIDPALAEDFAALRNEVDLDVPDLVVLDVLIAWTQLFGLLGFELFNQTRGIVDQHRALFDAATRRTAALIGLR